MEHWLRHRVSPSSSWLPAQPQLLLRAAAHRFRADTSHESLGTSLCPHDWADPSSEGKRKWKKLGYFPSRRSEWCDSRCSSQTGALAQVGMEGQAPTGRKQMVVKTSPTSFTVSPYKMQLHPKPQENKSYWKLMGVRVLHSFSKSHSKLLKTCTCSQDQPEITHLYPTPLRLGGEAQHKLETFANKLCNAAVLPSHSAFKVHLDRAAFMLSTNCTTYQFQLSPSFCFCCL